jgi:hypothetical protein
MQKDVLILVEKLDKFIEHNQALINIIQQNSLIGVLASKRLSVIFQLAKCVRS